MTFKLTPEQEAITAAFKTGGNMVIEAGAGTGKTSTLKAMATVSPKSFTGIYIAYNRAIAADAKASFPSRVRCATAHSFAFREVGLKYKARLDGPRMTARQAASILGVNTTLKFDRDQIILGPNKITRLALDTVQRFCYSADDKPGYKHVPRLQGAEMFHDEIASIVAPLAIKAWDNIVSQDGRLKFDHDHYLKLWAMSEPRLDCDYLMLDEAQDANPVIAQVVNAQEHAQKILVGDRSQAIYAWRGAVDAMTSFPADHRLLLSQSFRFGPAVATEANKWLELLKAPLRLTGFDQIKSKVATLDNPLAVLCRTNAECVARCMDAQQHGRKVAIVGGTAEIRRFAEAALDLQSGRGTSHPDLAAFSSWAQVREYVIEEGSGGADLKVLVNLVDDYGVPAVINVADRCVNENQADLIVSTAHKSKGREWSTVKIANDFREPKDDDEFDPEQQKGELMLAYVAVTRAREVLDSEGLAWIDRILPPAPKKINPFTAKAKGIKS